MKIGIDISQIAYEHTGVAQLLKKLIKHLLKIDSRNEYIFFFSSLRRNFPPSNFPPEADQTLAGHLPSSARVKVKTIKLPPTLLDILWNRLHVFPIEWFIGDVDVFISSDWTQPPTRKAKKATILYDFVVYKYPQETDKKIVETQKRRLAWVEKECDVIFCISEATKRDAMNILGIDEGRLRVIYPGI